MPVSVDEGKRIVVVPLREFLEVCDFDDFQYSGSHKKPDPPWYWFRIHLSFTNSPIWLQLTKPQRADFISLLALASQCGNLIPADRKWLTTHDISPKSLATLIELRLIRRFYLPPNHQRIKELRRIFSGAAPPQKEKEGRREEKRKESLSPAPVDKCNPSPASPASQFGTNTGQCQPVASVLDKASDGHDDRSWEYLTSEARPIVLKFGITTTDELFRIGGQRLHLTKKQCVVVIDRLKKEGTI